jgi:hypothetical protein
MRIKFPLFHKKASSDSLEINTTKPSQNKTAVNISLDSWRFKREIDQANVPTVINSYRKVINVYNYKMIVKALKKIEKIDNPIQRNIAYLRFIEPLAELNRLGYYDVNEDLPTLLFDPFIFDLFTFLSEYYPAIGARGQIKNLEDICNFIPELNGITNMIDYAELDAHDDIIKKINETGFIYAKDLQLIDSFNRVNLKEYLINRMLTNNIISKSKDGRLVIYKLSERPEA